MMFAIDCGNSRIKWRRFEAGQQYEKGGASLLDGSDPFSALGEALVEGVDRVLVANVAGAEVAERIAVTVRSGLSIMPEFVSVEAKAHGIECAYRHPQTLGVDRWLAMIAARRFVDGPFAVVCAGTAVTFDAVDAGGRHLGGLILPGDRLMIEAVAANTDQVPVVASAGDVVEGLTLLGCSTAEAVGRGARVALAAAVDRAVAVVVDALAAEVSVIVTGGDGPVLAQWFASKPCVRADLVLEGLSIVADEE